MSQFYTNDPNVIAILDQVARQKETIAALQTTLTSARRVIEYAAVCITRKELRISHDKCQQWLRSYPQEEE